MDEEGALAVAESASALEVA
jgi:hypothetical protein